MEKVSRDLCMTSLRQNVVKLAWDDNIPALITCWTAKFFKIKEATMLSTSFAFTLTTVQSQSELDL